MLWVHFLIRHAESAELEVQGGGVLFFCINTCTPTFLKLSPETLIISLKMYEVLLFSSINPKNDIVCWQKFYVYFFEWGIPETIKKSLGILKDNINRKQKKLEFPSNHEAILKKNNLYDIINYKSQLRKFRWFIIFTDKCNSSLH